MNYKAKSIRTFIGAKNYNESRTFYTDYVKKWCNNSMVFLEVDNLDKCWKELNGKGLDGKYKYVRFTEIKQFDWGREFFMHDPSGILWHFGQFKK